MCLGSRVEFLISAGSVEQRQDSAEERRGSAALIWVTGLWGTVITPLSSSGLKWCSSAWRTGANEPVHSQPHGHTFQITEVSFSWNTCTLSLVWERGSISNTSKSGLFHSVLQNGCLPSCSLKTRLVWNIKHTERCLWDNTWRDRDRARGLQASPLICPVPVPGLNKAAVPTGSSESHAKQNLWWQM